jgi:hypothetical protein
VLSRLHADRRTAPIPVVFLAPERQARRREKWMALGAAGVIAKPFDPVALAAALRRFVAVEGVLAPAREDFLQRLKADASALAAYRRHLAHTRRQPALMRIYEIAHGLAGAGGTYGFAGITCESVALSAAAESNLAGHARPIEVERALDRPFRATPTCRAPFPAGPTCRGKTMCRGKTICPKRSERGSTTLSVLLR